MKADDLHVFIEGTLNYFRQTTGEEAAIDVPYLKGPEPVLLDLTGIIGISGSSKGCVYLTATHEMLAAVAGSVLGSEHVTQEMIRDLAGEVANTIAGNARQVLGSGFMISVPILVSGLPEDISLPLRVPTFVIPFSWRAHRAYLVVGTEEVHH